MCNIFPELIERHCTAATQFRLSLEQSKWLFQWWM